MIQETSMSDKVYEMIKTRILSGEYRPGQRIPSQIELCEQYQVSRITIQSAIQKLCGLGLVETKRGGGTYVLEQSSKNAITSVLNQVVLNRYDRINIYEFRSLLEIESAGLAALRADSRDVDDMRRANYEMQHADSPDEMARHDLDFHALIARATGNEYINKVFDVMKNVYFMYLRQNTATIGAYGVRVHEMICQAIELRDRDKARSLMQEHLKESAELIFEQNSDNYSDIS